MPHLATELLLCERLGWTLEYIRAMELSELQAVIAVLGAIDSSSEKP